MENNKSDILIPSTEQFMDKLHIMLKILSYQIHKDICLL